MVALTPRSASGSPAGAPAAGRRGSIVAIIGVAGNGQSQLAAQLRDTHPEAGFIPEDRTRDGIIATMSIADNLLLRGHKNAEEIIARYSIKARSPKQRAGSLSGGNQQKVVLARELERHPPMLVAAEPTRGLDIESAAFVHDQLRAAADAGTNITLITSDLDEAFALADAVQVIYRGKLSEPMTPAVAAERAPALMAGLG
jgi:simple sugar transport system ATP-binding protein